MSDASGLVLVVDDAQINRRILVRALTAQGHATLEAEDGRQALELLAVQRERRIDVVLLDLEMPELDSVVRCIEILQGSPQPRRRPAPDRRRRRAWG